MLAFESQTPQELLKEVAEYLRQLAQRANYVPAKTKARREINDARHNALIAAAIDLEDAGILPAQSILRTQAAPRPRITDLNDCTCGECDDENRYCYAPNAEAARHKPDAGEVPATTTAHLPLANALAVLVLNHSSRAWLEANDPKALAQAVTALEAHDPGIPAKLQAARDCAEARLANLTTPLLAVTGRRGTGKINITVDTNYGGILSPDGTARLLPCEVCGNCFWVPANTVALTCDCCAEAERDPAAAPDCADCGHSHDDHHDDDLTGECWHGSGDGNRCDCRRYIVTRQPSTIARKHV